MKQQQEMVKSVWIDENGNHTIEEITKEQAEKDMLYSQGLDEMSKEEQQETLAVIDAISPKELECK